VRDGQFWIEPDRRLQMLHAFGRIPGPKQRNAEVVLQLRKIRIEFKRVFIESNALQALAALEKKPAQIDAKGSVVRSGFQSLPK
jgi:hypothetical protein